MARPRLLLVTTRPPRVDGRGDQRRSHEIWQSLSQAWDTEVVSWLPDTEEAVGRRGRRQVIGLGRALVLSATRPCCVAYVQRLGPRAVVERVRAADHDVVMFVTDRTVPRWPTGPTVVDFVDDLGGVAFSRARTSTWPLRLFWGLEGWRTRRLDRRLAERAAVSMAHSSHDADAISPRVRVIGLSSRARPMPDDGDRIVFYGNLFYAPNHEAAMWVCTALAPHLAAAGLDPRRIVVAGRRPQSSLRLAAERSGVDLRPDVDDLNEVLGQAAVVLAPMELGAGAQYKVIDAVAAGRACVLSPVANAGLDLVDGASALIRERDAAAFADAALTLLQDPSLRERLIRGARAQLARFEPSAVAAEWLEAVAAARGGRSFSPTQSAAAVSD